MLFNVKILERYPSRKMSPVKFYLGAAFAQVNYAKFIFVGPAIRKNKFCQKKVPEKYFFPQDEKGLGEVFQNSNTTNDIKTKFYPRVPIFFRNN